MSELLTYAFSFDCTDAAGELFRLDVVARSDGQLEVASDYDLDIDLAWAELSDYRRESECAKQLGLWDEYPVVFLLGLAPVAIAVKTRVVAGFARHIWTHTAMPIPETIAAVVEFAAKVPPRSGLLGHLVLRTDMLAVRGYDAVRDAGNVAQLGYRAAQSLGEAWREAALGGGDADGRLVDVTLPASRTAS